MAMKQGPPAACAACKYQRRKCTPDCPLAPYFPPEQPRQFQNAHRLFGVSNILKILNRIPPHLRSDAMRSIIYESNIRDCYPVHGCLGVLFALQLQIHQAQLEMDVVNHALSVYRTGVGTSVVEDYFDGEVNNELYTQQLTLVADNTDVNNVDPDRFPFGVVAAPAVNNFLEYDEVSTYFETVDDDRPCESSSETSPKEKDLKSAAACFTLTSSVNDHQEQLLFPL